MSAKTLLERRSPVPWGWRQFGSVGKRVCLHQDVSLRRVQLLLGKVTVGKRVRHSSIITSHQI